MAAPTAPITAAPARPAGTALYVGDLPREATDAHLYNAFADIGQIRLARVCIDSQTKASLGYGYVNFFNAADAERAFNAKANWKILGKPCRVMWSQRDPALRRSGVGNLYVKNLAPNVDQGTLQSAFSKYGDILSCKVALDEKGNSKGFGFVHFESPESAKKAIEECNGIELEGKTLYVGNHIPKKNRPSAAETWTNVFIKNLPATVDEARLRELFGKFGSITSVYLNDPIVVPASSATANGEPPKVRFGFVNYATHEEAIRAVAEMNESKLDDHELYVGRAQTKRERSAALARNHKQREPAQSNLYIKPLEDGVTKEDLEKYFGTFGTVASAALAVDSNGKPRGFGYVSFTTPEAAQLAMHQAQRQPLPGFTKPLYISIHEPRAVRQHLQQQRMFQQQHLPYAYPYPPYPHNRMPVAHQPPRSRTNQATRRTPAAPTHLPAPMAHAPVVVQPNAAAAAAAAAAVAAPPAVTPAARLPSKDTLLKMPPAEATVAIGDYLFNILGNYAPRQGKITGMILKMFADDITGLIELVHNPSELDANIQQANHIITQATAAQ